MPIDVPHLRAEIDLSGGEFTNVPSYSLPEGKSSSVVNFMVTESGASLARPGTALFGTPASSVLTTAEQSDTRVLGLYGFGEWLVAVDGNRRVYKFSSDGAVTDITGSTALPGRAVPNFLNDNGLLLIFGGGAPLKWEGGAAPCEMLSSDTGLPNPTHMCLFNRYLMANNIGTDRIDFSDPVDHSWNLETQFFTAESSNDPVLAVDATFGEFYAFGSQTIDCYYFTGADAAGPFSLGWTIQRGIVSGRSQVKVNNSMFFLDNERKFMTLDERMPKVMSLEIESSLQRLTRVDDCILHRIEFEGRHLLALVFPTDATVFVFDYVLNQWTEWREFSEGAWQPMSMLAYAYQGAWNRHFCSSFTTSSIYELSSSFNTDHGNTRRCERVTAPITLGSSKQKEWTKIQFRCLRGGFDDVATVTAPKMLVWWKDDNKGWMGPRPVQLARHGDSAMFNGQLTRMGKCRSRELKIVMDSDIPFTLMNAEVEYIVLSS